MEVNNATFLGLDRCDYFFEFNFQQPLYALVINLLLCVLNILSSVFTVLTNTVVLIAIYKNSPLHTSPNALLASLALSDLLTGIVAQPAFVLYKVAEIQRSRAVSCVGKGMLEVVCQLAPHVSMVTLTGISIERFLAVYFPLRYNDMVTLPRVLAVAMVIWLYCIAFSLARIWISPMAFWGLFFASTALCVVITTISYWKIFNVIRIHRNRIHNEQQLSLNFHGECDQLNLKTQSRNSLTMLFIVFALYISSSPFLFSLIPYFMHGYTTEVKVATDITATMVCLGSMANPVIYCLRIRGIRNALSRLLENTLLSCCIDVSRVDLDNRVEGVTDDTRAGPVTR